VVSPGNKAVLGQGPYDVCTSRTREPIQLAEELRLANRFYSIEKTGSAKFGVPSPQVEAPVLSPLHWPLPPLQESSAKKTEGNAMISVSNTNVFLR